MIPFERLFPVFLLFLAIHSSAQQLDWEKKYPRMPNAGNHQRHATRVEELPDSTILLLGHEQSYEDLKKLDKNGEIIWTRYFQPDSIPGCNAELTLVSFEALNNGNILLVGEKLNCSYPALAYLALLDPNGQDLSDTIYYGYTYLMKPFCSAKAANGVLIGGYKPDWPANTQFAMAMKIDSNFVKQWEFVLPADSGGDYSQFGTVIANPDGTFDCFGQTRFGYADHFKLLYVKLSASGSKIFTRTYPDSNFMQFADACSGPGFRALLGMHYGGLGITYHILKTDENGQELWTKRYPDNDSIYYYPMGLARRHDNGFLVTGQSYYYNIYNMPYASGIYLAKTDSAGNRIWEEDYGMACTDTTTPWATFKYGRDVTEAVDGSYLLAASDLADSVNAPLLSLLKIKEGYTPTGWIPGFVHEVSVYPNPFRTLTTIGLPAGTIVGSGELNLYDLAGNPVRMQRIVNSGKVTVSRDGLPSGIYLFSVSDGKQILFRGKLLAN